MTKLEALCLRFGLSKLEMSNSIFGGSCPLCGAKRAFFVWLDKNPIIAICYECKIKMKIWETDLRNGG